MAVQEQEKQAVQAAMDALREEYQIRISAAERKVSSLGDFVAWSFCCYCILFLWLL